MGKLGKKARKFAKKNLQSVLRNRRKTKAMFKRKSSTKDEQDNVEDPVGNKSEIANRRNTVSEDIEEISLDALFSEDESETVADASDSDGFLSEDLGVLHATISENESNLEEDSVISTLSTRNRKIHEELAMQKNKLDRLKKKDPEFGKFLEIHSKRVETFRDGEYSEDDESDNHGMRLVDEDDSALNKGKVLTSSVINSWCQLVKVENKESALISLLNAYRAACHYGTGSTIPSDAASYHSIQNSETFCNILVFVLHGADNIFRRLLNMSSSSSKKERVLELRNTSKWNNLKPLIKSYLRSTIFLLNQVTDSSILSFSLTRLRSSIIFFAAFPSLLRRLIKITVHLWATGGGALSSCSFFILRDVAVAFSSDHFDTCLIKAYKAYIAHSKVLEIVNFEHIQFLRNSFVELCSLDVQKSCSKLIVSIQQLAKIFQYGLRTKKREALKKLCSWEYANCIDLWVMFISANVRDYDIQNLFYTIVQIINGVAYLFPGPRYFPLRLKCIQWLNKLSSSSGIFIPVASFVLDVLEYKIGKEGGKQVKAINFHSFLKLPKHWLKSQNFQEECVFSAIELLSVHFAQWSYHISFSELATIPLIRLRKFHETTAIESLRRMVRRLIDQVEQNVEIVQKKRDEVSFSPNDRQAVESFLQLERSSLNNPFTQYCRSIVEKAAIRNLHMNEKISFPEHKKLKRKRVQPSNSVVDPSANKHSERSYLSAVGEKDESKGKKRRALMV